jgi:hypothetical protein
MFIENVEEMAIREQRLTDDRDARLKRRAGSDAESSDEEEDGEEEV